MIVRDEYLIKINAKNKIQRIHIQLLYHDLNKEYMIQRITGQFGGKETEQPLLLIEYGRQGRTVAEQAAFKYSSMISNYLNAGYKKLSSITDIPYLELTEDQMRNLLNSGGNTDTKGIPKPMLAKSSDDLSSDIFEKEVYVSRKIDGEPKNLCRR